MLKVSKSVCILTTQAIMKLLKSKEAAAAVDIKSWPMVLDTGELYTHTQQYSQVRKEMVWDFHGCINNSASVLPPDDLPRKKSPQMYKPPTPEMLAYLDFSVSTTGILAGVKVC